MLTELGQLIETHRKTRHMTQTELVKQIGLEQSNYSAMIHGHRPINDDILSRVIDILSIPDEAIHQVKTNRHDKKQVIANLRKLSPASIRKLRDYSDLLLLAEKPPSQN